MAEILTHSTAAYKACIQGYMKVFLNTELEVGVKNILLATQQDSTFAIGHFFLSITHLNRNEVEEARNAIETTLKYDYKVPERFRFEIIEKHLKISPFNPEAHYEMALAYFEMGKQEKALEHLHTALQVWKNADAEYKPAKRAREKLAEWQV